MGSGCTSGSIDPPRLRGVIRAAGGAACGHGDCFIALCAANLEPLSKLYPDNGNCGPILPNVGGHMP
jgi:hypothetical protein